MSKAVVQDVLDAGFQADGFGGSATFATSGGMVDGILGEASAWASNYVGATNYAAAASPALAYYKLRAAEVSYTAAELWRRRAAYIDRSAGMGRQDSTYLDRREMLAHGADAMTIAQGYLAEAAQLLGVDTASILPGTGISVGHVETGRYPIASEAALNG